MYSVVHAHVFLRQRAHYNRWQADGSCLHKATAASQIKHYRTLRMPRFVLFHLSRCCWCSHRVHKLVDMKQGDCICPLSWSVHFNFVRDGNYSERGWACTPHPPWSNFSIMTEYARKRRLPLCVFSVGGLSECSFLFYSAPVHMKSEELSSGLAVSGQYKGVLHLLLECEDCTVRNV
jgi:hypothetical protein